MTHKHFDVNEISKETFAAIRAIKAECAKLGERYVGTRNRRVFYCDGTLGIQIEYIAEKNGAYRHAAHNIAMA